MSRRDFVLLPCHECVGLGDIDDATCGVCLGDAYILDGESVTVLPSRLTGDGTRWVDHSGLGHECDRCQPDESVVVSTSYRDHLDALVGTLPQDTSQVDQFRRYLMEAAGVADDGDLDNHTDNVVGWLAHWELSVVAGVAALLGHARRAGGGS